MPNNADLSSQLGYVLMLADELQTTENVFTITGNILHWKSMKCKRITRALFASELIRHGGRIRHGLRRSADN